MTTKKKKKTTAKKPLSRDQQIANIKKSAQGIQSSLNKSVASGQIKSGGSSSKGSSTPVSSGNPVDTNLYLKQGETPDQYKARTEAYNASKNTPQPTDAGQNTSGFSDLKSLSIAKTPPSNTQQSPEDWAKAFMDTMSQNNPDTSGVGTQSTQGDAEAGTQPGVNDAVAGVMGQQAPGGGSVGGSAGGSGLLPGQVTPGGTQMTGGVPMATVATGGYQKIGPAYFQKTSDGMAAVTDPTVISGLKHGTIPFSTGQLDGTTFSSHSVPLVATGATTQKNKVKNALGFPSTTDGIDENADIGTTYQSQKDKYGLTQTQTDFWSDPQKTITDMTKSIYKMSGMEDANDAIKDITSDLEDLENKRDDEIGDINDNPWLTEGVRLRQIASVESRYEDKIANHTNKLRLLEDVRNNAQQQAQFAIGTAISLWDKERTFQQHQIDSWNEQAQRQFDNEMKIKAYNMDLSQLGKTGLINEFLFYKENGGSKTWDEYANPVKPGETGTWSITKLDDGSIVKIHSKTGEIVPYGGSGNVGGGISATQKTLDQFAFLKETTQSAIDLSGSAGPNLITQGLGNVFVGDTKVKQLAKKLDTLKVNILTMSTDPAIKKYFGPQMTENDTKLMTSAGTTMDAYANSPADLKKELERYQDLIIRAEQAVRAGIAGETQVGADGKTYIIID